MMAVEKRGLSQTSIQAEECIESRQGRGLVLLQHSGYFLILWVAQDARAPLHHTTHQQADT